MEKAKAGNTVLCLPAVLMLTSGLVLQTLGVLISATPVADLQRGDAAISQQAGFGLTEVLVSADLVVSGVGVQLQASIGRAVQQQQRASLVGNAIATRCRIASTRSADDGGLISVSRVC